ncbi:MAG: MiaB/RimO family radical SAM methylthiotransferase, partial [Chlamydiia bacterium]|nr:MiaB/RimO family radical SAM methylthiotransferase [Chlamydiia bacterium]
MKKFNIKTLGCRVNQYDTQYVREQLLRAGWVENTDVNGADLCVINTCTITENSDTKAKYFLRQAQRENPKAKMILTGCFTEKMKKLSGVDVFVSNLEKEQFLVKAGLLTQEEAFEILGSHFHISQFEGRTRAFVKAQDGCDAFCSFCIVPFTRGRSKSRRVEEVLQEVRALVLNGYQEVVLTGVHLGSYGLKKEDPNSLADIIETVSRVPGLKRLRLSSLEPMGLSSELIKRLSGLENLSPHFHLPVQSGNNRVLEVMRRNYHVESFLYHTELVKKYF